MSGTLPRWRGAAFRAISTAGFAALSERPADFGPAPELKWIAVADLVVDTSYQRDISRQGVTNVRAIAANFSWAKFGALIVAPVDGKFAVIDGQHRVTAAALLGIRDVPAQVLAISREEQAAAFNAINSVVTRVHALQSHAAAVAAGEPGAVEIHDVAGAEEVRQLRAQLGGGAPLSVFLSLGLTQSQARIVSVLNARAVATREAVRLALYSDGADEGAGTENVFDVFMLQLRRRLAPRGIVIETVRGVGWRLPPASRAALSAAVARWAPA